ncbi:hypothetical protein EF888_17495 [Silicimonas algicola]|uniref:Uncharacterized protein n=1 Tax=Silicimonas algicola TaxID=1826607 RepID=A0A316G5M6_9RHOB|nr:hypothetical protein [Silicimonas algicola]AZQ68764.1 hypothetical protein EF888_17495 [Silicimonas algicola]PWK56158.1 hypothetical protein C8D95_105225 [Silicimonas algicola]
MDLDRTTRDLAERMATQLRVKGTDLTDVVSRAGRKLPRRLRAEATVLIEAQALARNPKLGRRVDQARVLKAERRLRAYLDRLDSGSEKRAEILDRLAAVGFVVLVVAGVLFYVLVQQGAFR